MRKYRARKPNSAKALAVNTRKVCDVTPKVAGIESKAKSKSVEPIAIITKNMGVAKRFPLTLINSFEPWNSSTIDMRFLRVRTMKLSFGSGSSSQCLNSPIPVQIKIAPNIAKVKEKAEIATAPIEMKIALKTNANITPMSRTLWWWILGTANWARMITKINKLSMESEYSTK